MSSVRAFVAGDIPEVVALRNRVFAKSAHRSPRALGEYFERIFFHNPWNTGAHSLVHVDDAGRVTGFLGVLGRRATYRNQPIEVAVCTQFMVDPGERGVAGVRLLKTLLAGEQDLALADVSNEESKKMWVALGGAASRELAQLWTQPLRPLRYRAAQSGSLAARGIARLARPLLELMDRGGARWPAPRGLAASSLTPDAIATLAGDVVGRGSLRTNDDAESTRWLFEQLRSKRDMGTLRGVLLGEGGHVVGWYLYFENRGGVGEVVQLVAARGKHRDVLASLFHDAWTCGLTAVTGRADHDVLAALDRSTALVRDGDTAVLVHSIRKDIADAVTNGDAYLSRLDGEWWMSF